MALADVLFMGREVVFLLEGSLYKLNHNDGNLQAINGSQHSDLQAINGSQHSDLQAINGSQHSDL